MRAWRCGCFRSMAWQPLLPNETGACGAAGCAGAGSGAPPFTSTHGAPLSTAASLAHLIADAAMVARTSPCPEPYQGSVAQASFWHLPPRLRPAEVTLLRPFVTSAGIARAIISCRCGCSSMVELEPSKLATRVRFSSPAPKLAEAPHSAGLSHSSNRYWRRRCMRASSSAAASERARSSSATAASSFAVSAFLYWS